MKFIAGSSDSSAAGKTKWERGSNHVIHSYPSQVELHYQYEELVITDTFGENELSLCNRIVLSHLSKLPTMGLHRQIGKTRNNITILAKSLADEARGWGEVMTT